METTQEKVSFKSCFSVSFADGMCATLNGLVTGGGFSYFFTKYLGLNEGLASIIWIIFAIWNAFNDPLFGYISDKTKSKLGRRIPYIRYGSAIYAFIFILSWFLWPFGGSQTALFIQMLTCLFLFDTLYTAIATSLYVMPFEMATSNKARGKILIFKLVFSIISLGVPLILFPLIKPEVNEDPTSFQITMTLIGVASFLVIFFSTFFYKEKGYQQKEKQLPLFKSIAQCFKNKAFIIFEVISFTIVFVQTILMQGVIYYFDEFKNIPMMTCYVSLGIGAICGMVIWLALREKKGMHIMMILMCASLGLGTLLMLAFGRILIISILSFFLIGIGFSGGMYLIPIMNGDVIDFDEVNTNLRREGMYAGVNSFITKPAISLANAAFLMIISWFGYDQNLESGLQNEFAKTGILVAWMAIPLILLIISLISMFFYPLHGKKWDDTKNSLIALHKVREIEYNNQSNN